LLHAIIAAMLERMSEQFMLQPKPFPWAGGEPRVFAVDREQEFPVAIKNARLIDVPYQGGGITTLIDNIAASCGVNSSSFQAFLENLEEISHELPLVIVVRDADRLLADVGPALIHFMAGWEGFCRHASGISAMYLVLETGPRATVNAAFYPGGLVDWRPR